MKRVIILVISFLFVFSSINTLTAQNSGDLDLGAGITYGFDIEELGIQVIGTYALNNKIRVGADFIYWLSEDESVFGASYSSTLFEINGNVHYLFYNQDKFVIYAIGSLGIHYASVKVDVPGFGSESASDSELGLGFGAGFEYNLGPAKLYVEPRLFISGFDQLALSAGFKIPLNK